MPELKALKAELASQRRENDAHFAGIRAEMAAVRTEGKITSDSIRAELQTNSDSTRAEIEALRVELRLRDEKQTQAISPVSEKMGTLMEVRERLAILEDRAQTPLTLQQYLL